MTELNWSLGQQGTCVVEVSQEATHTASVANNLLSEVEDKLWISGDAPQHVTLKLSSRHPPLWYVGWHVWHDYLTNPKTVEIASGPTSEVLTALLVCEALPGAGTQVWKLPTAIPPEHTFVRFKILDTFGPGPTYMNNLLLLARDPGPRYRSGSESYPQAHHSSGLSSPSCNPPPPAGPGSGSEARASLPPTRGNYDPELVASRPPATPNSSTEVGLFVRGESTHLQNPNVSRMNDLLKGLDEDIRALKPIKTVSPSKNMLIYVPPEPTTLPPLEFSMEEEEEEEEEEELPPKKAKKKKSRKPHSPQAIGNARLQETPPVIHYAAPAPPPVHIPPSYETRLSSLEQAVASLSQSVQHQREDLIMIKRLLLQQATDRRHELERQMRKEREAAEVPVAAPSALVKNAVSGFPFSHQHVSVEFPEDTLRTFVESVMAEKMEKMIKKTEQKLKQKSQSHLEALTKQLTSLLEKKNNEGTHPIRDLQPSTTGELPAGQTARYPNSFLESRTTASSTQGGSPFGLPAGGRYRSFQMSHGQPSPHQYGPISIVKDTSQVSSRY